MKVLLIHHILGNELLIFGKDSEDYKNFNKKLYSNVEKNRNVLPISNTIRNLCKKEKISKKLVINVIHNQDILDEFLVNDLGIIAAANSKHLTNHENLTYLYIKDNNNIHTFTNHEININDILNENYMISANELEKDRNTDIHQSNYKNLYNINEFIIIHETAYDNNKKRLVDRDDDGILNEKDILFNEVKKLTKNQIDIQNQLLKQIAKEITYDNSSYITDEIVTIDHIHYETNIFDKNLNSRSNIKSSIVIERIFQNLEVSNIIPSVYYASIKNPHNNKLKLFEVNEEGVIEPYLNIMEILTYKRKLVYYPELQNYIEKQKEDFIWIKINLTQNDTKIYFNDLLANVFIYKNGHIEILISKKGRMNGNSISSKDNYIDKVNSILNEYIISKKNIYILHENEKQNIILEEESKDSYHEDEEPELYIPSSIDLIDSFRILDMKYNISIPTTKTIIKGDLKNTIDIFGSRLRILHDTAKNSYFSLNLKMGDIISNTEYEFLILLEQLYSSHHIHNNPQGWVNAITKYYPDEINRLENIRLFYQELCDPVYNEQVFTMGPVINIKKGNVKAFNFEITNIHSLKSYQFVLRLLNTFVNLYIQGKKSKGLREGTANIGINIEEKDELDEDELENDIDEEHEYDDILDEEDEELLMEDEESRSGKMIMMMEDDTPPAAAGAGEDGDHTAMMRPSPTVLTESVNKEIVYDPNFEAPPNYLINRINEKARELFNQKNSKPYTKTCTKQQERQPVILTQQEFNNIIKNYAGAFGFKKKLESGKKITVELLRGDTLTDEEKREAMEDFFVYTYVNKEKLYYICPKYWCIIENRPMTAEEILDGECGGKIIDKKRGSKNKGKYIYARDAPSYFGTTRNKDGFVVFKNDVNITPRFTDKLQFEKDGVLLSLPCCFKAKDKDFMKANMKKGKKNIMHQMFKENYKKLAGESNTLTANINAPKNFSAVVKTKEGIRFNEYIINDEKYNLRKDQVSVLPSRMANLVFHEQKCLSASSNISKRVPGCIFRKGIDYKDNVMGIFYDIRKYSQYYNLTVKNQSLTTFKQLIHKAYTFEKFIKYCKGTLPDIFFNENLEKISVKLTKDDKKVLSSLLENFKDEEKEDMIYKYIGSYDLFKKYILDDTETKNIEYFLELMQEEDAIKDKNGDYVNILSGLNENINIIIFELKIEGRQPNIMIRCPYFGNLKYHENKYNIFIYKYKNNYQPLFYRSNEEYGDIYLIDINELIEIMNETFETQTVMKTHMGNLLQSLRFSIDNYKDQCKPKGEFNYNIIDELVNPEEEDMYPYELIGVYLGKDNHIHGLKLVNVDLANSKDNKIIKNSVFTVTVNNMYLDDNVLNNPDVKIYNIKNMKHQNLDVVMMNLDAIKNNNRLFEQIGFYKYVIEDRNNPDDVIGIMLQNKTIIPVKKQTVSNIKKGEVYTRMNISDYMNIVYKIDDIKLDSVQKMQRTLRLMIEMLLMNISKKKVLRNILILNKILDYRTYLMNNFEKVFEYLNNNTEKRITKLIPDYIFKKSDQEILEDYSGLFYNSKTKKFRLYKLFENDRKKVLQFLTEILLNYLYKNPHVRKMVDNSTYQYNYSIDNMKNAIVLTESELQDLINQDLKRVDNKYVQREHHYENMNIEGLKNNVISSFYGSIIEARPFNSTGGNKGANWSQLLPNTLTFIEKRNELDGWKSFAFGLKQNMDIDDMKTDYINNLVEYLNESDKNKEEFNDLIEKSKLDKKALFTGLILDDEEEMEETLEMIIMSNSYFITEMDIKMFVKFYETDVILLRDNIISKSNINKYNFADHYRNKNNNPDHKTLFMITYNIPLVPYKSYSNILFLDETDTNPETKYKPFVFFNELMNKNQAWAQKYETWKNSNKQEIKIINV
jgi:hypothetical protein